MHMIISIQQGLSQLRLFIDVTEYLLSQDIGLSISAVIISLGALSCAPLFRRRRV